MAYMTDEERKKPWEWHGDKFIFNTTVDLSKEITVTPIFDWEVTQLDLIKDVTVFIAHFMVWTHPKLNGFSGIDCIRWKNIDRTKPITL